MKRYLMAYSKRTLTVRDRLTEQTKVIKDIDEDVANEFINKIKDVNYTVPKTKSKVKTYVDFNLSSDNFTPEYGWLNPNKITWHKEELKENTEKGIKTLSDKLDELLAE